MVEGVKGEGHIHLSKTPNSNWLYHNIILFEHTLSNYFSQLFFLFLKKSGLLNIFFFFLQFGMFLLFIYLVLFDSWDISFWESSSYLFLRKTSKRASCEFPTIFFFLFYFLGYIEDLLLSLKVQYINMWFFSVLWFWIHSKRTIWSSDS